VNLESQLLKIIEEQQNQLKQQQQEQEKALQLIQQQSLTIEQLKNYVNELVQRSNLVAKENENLVKLIKDLQKPQLSQSLFTNLEKNLNLYLQTRLEKLVDELEIETNIKLLLAEILSNLVQIEIEKQTGPLAMQITERMRSVEQFQQKLAELIQALSGKL
jgi:hypothetical protein